MRSPPVPPATTPEPLPSSKLTSRHLQRLAVVYIRQSTPQQLIHHQESTRLQYGLVERAIGLGWPREQVLVIDEDLGRSGASAEGRSGFQRLVAEVGLDHVGAIFSIEMSRLARSGRDWYQLLDVCAVFGTLLGDLDGLYDPTHYNDRLLLGLKGTMSEAELHLLRQRMQQGRFSKARRGELSLPLPMGYVRLGSGQVVKDPDEQAQAVVQRIFDQFEAQGSLGGVLRDLVKHQIQLPIRLKSGPRRGELEWRRPSRRTLACLLHNPAYAGVYAYGRKPTDPRRQKPGHRHSGRRTASPEEWVARLKGQLPAYISYEQYENNQEQLARSQSKQRGVVRSGAALLAGLIVCGRCNRRMSVNYGCGNARYVCSRETAEHGGAWCQSLKARPADAKVSELVLKALEPSALEVSLKVAEDLEAEHAKLVTHWKQKRERAQYEVDRAMRQYNAVEPENRLVARTLEKLLEEKLAAQKEVELEHDRWKARQPMALTEAERAEIRKLAGNLPALWNAKSTTGAERQTIIRQLVERVVVTVVGQSEQVQMKVEWIGGHQTECTVQRTVASSIQLSFHSQLVERLREMRKEGLSAREMAERLNQQGWRSAKKQGPYSEAMVRAIAVRSGLTRAESMRHLKQAGLRPHEWTVTTLATELGMPPHTLHNWIKLGWVEARQFEKATGEWAIRADAKELRRLRVLRATPESLRRLERSHPHQ